MDYDVWFHGMIIGNIQAMTDKAANKLARQIYGKDVSATRTVR